MMRKKKGTHMGLESLQEISRSVQARTTLPKRIGFGPKPDGEKVVGGDLNRLNARVRLAKDFQAHDTRGL